MRNPAVLLFVAAFITAGCSPKQRPDPKATAATEATHAAASEGAVLPTPDATVASAQPASAQPAAALPVIGPAAAWTLRDPSGHEVSSASFKGKVVVLDFWATWCPPCREEIPGYVDLYRKYGQDRLAIIGVSMDQAGPSVVAAFVKKFGVTYPVVMADDSIVTAFGGMEAIPTTFLIDQQGRIRDKKVGAEPTEEYEKKIKSLLD